MIDADDDRDDLHEFSSASRALHAPERLTMLADGVFAIAMTLYVLDVRIPESVGNATSDFNAEFPDLASRFGVFAAAFFLTARFWISHHHLMSYVHHVDTNTIVITTQFLFGIAATPVAMSTLLRYGDAPLAIACAAGLLALTTLLELRLWLHVASPKRGLADIGPNERRATTTQLVYNIALYVIVIPVAFVLPDPAYSMLLWLALPLSVRAAHQLRRLRRPRAASGSRSDAEPRVR